MKFTPARIRTVEEQIESGSMSIREALRFGISPVVLKAILEKMDRKDTKSYRRICRMIEERETEIYIMPPVKSDRQRALRQHRDDLAR